MNEASLLARKAITAAISSGVTSRTYQGDGRRLLQYEFARPSPAPAILPSVQIGFGSGRVGIGTSLGVGFGGYGAPADICVLVLESWDGRITSFNRQGRGCVAKAD
jgi:hypothetical protein